MIPMKNAATATITREYGDGLAPAHTTTRGVPVLMVEVKCTADDVLRSRGPPNQKL